jgi:hypothetical protein
VHHLDELRSEPVDHRGEPGQAGPPLHVGGRRRAVDGQVPADEAATGSGEIATNITGVAAAAAQSSQTLNQMGGAIGELARMSEDLRARVAGFRY